MAQPVKPLEHVDPDKKSDEALRSEARSHLGATPSLQLVAELYTKLRTLDLPWWKPEMLRERWPAIERMRWYKARPDLRQKVTSTLTGLQPRAARKKAPDFQGALIDAVIDEGDVSARAFEDSFDPTDLVVYGPVESFWSGFLEKMPWKQDTAVHQELVAWLFDALLSDHSAIDGMRRKPILTAWEARTAIDGRVWHTRMPLEIRVAVDEARFRKERERPGEPFHAASDLSIAVATTIASSIPLRDLLPVFVAAEKIMGFGKPAPAPEPSSPKKSEGAPEVAAAKPPPVSPAVSAVIPSSPSSTPSTPSTAPALSSPAPAAAAPAPAAPAPAAAPATPATSRPSVLPPANASPSIPPPANASPSIPPPAAAPFAPPPAAPLPPSPPVQPLPPAQPSSLRSLSSPPPALASTPKPAAPDAVPAARQAMPSSSLVSKPADRPTGSGPIEVSPAVRADFAGASAPAKPESAPKAASITSPRAAAATLIDALAHIPAEDERTNPWDIPSEDGSEDTGVTAPAKRDESGSGKRKRSGRG